MENNNSYLLTNTELINLDINNINKYMYDNLETNHRFAWSELKTKSLEYGIKVHHQFLLFEKKATAEIASIKTISTFLVKDNSERTMIDLTMLAIEITKKQFSELTYKEFGMGYIIPNATHEEISESLNIGRNSQN